MAFGMSILIMTGSVFAPFGLVFLPKASQLIAGKDMEKLKEYILKLAGLTILLTLSGLIVFEVFANVIIKVYLGKTFGELVVIARIIMLGCLAYTLYVSLRSILDAYYIKAVNAVNIVIALAFFLIASGLGYMLHASYMVLVCVFTGALYLLGLLTLFEIRKLLKA